MEFDEQEDTVEEMEEEIPATGSYDSLGNSGRFRIGAPTQTGGGEIGSSGGAGGGGGGSTGARTTVRYKECLKNHAVGHGGHAVDGCGEFMAGGEEGTLESLKCAACNCHRNFHRKETEGDIHSSTTTFHNTPPPYPPYYHHRGPPPAGYLHLGPPPPIGHYPHHQHRPLALQAASGGTQSEDMSNPSSSGGGGGGGSSKKRFRTKFTVEQKAKMLEFAERLGWRIQKHDEEAVQQFCEETSVKRHVLKVWMHNNKHTLSKKP